MQEQTELERNANKASRQTFKMSDDLWRRVRIQAAIEGRTMRELVNHAIQHYLQEVAINNETQGGTR